MKSNEAMHKLGVHLSHCNFGENAGHCKYGDDDCPALTESWSWFGNALQRAEGLKGLVPFLCEKHRALDLRELNKLGALECPCCLAAKVGEQE